jgi:transposase
MAQIEVIGGVDRRRRWTEEQKQAHVAEAFSPGVNVKAYARREDVATSLLYHWRREMTEKPASDDAFTRVVAIADNATVLTAPTIRTGHSPLVSEPAAIELEVRGSKIRMTGGVPAPLALAVIRALVRR